MLEIIDEYTWIKDIQIITQDRHHIPGLKNFTHQHSFQSFQPSPLHYHTNILELHCMIKGERTTVLEHNDEISSHIIRGNEVFLVFPFELHGNGNQPQAPCEFFAMQIDLSDPDNMLCLNKEYSNILCKNLLSVKNRHMQLSGTEIRLLRTAFNLFSSNKPSDVQNGVLFLSCFLSSLCYLSRAECNVTSESGISPKIQQTLDYIRENIASPITLEKLADVSGYSLSHFKALFKSEVGITPNEYILHQKLQSAKFFLETSDIPITELSFNLGFSSSNYFSSVFRRMLGCTPSEYRKKNSTFQMK